MRSLSETLIHIYKKIYKQMKNDKNYKSLPFSLFAKTLAKELI